jgi:hypothetical protein
MVAQPPTLLRKYKKIAKNNRFAIPPPATVRPDLFTAGDLLRFVVAAFHQQIRQDPGNQARWNSG